MLSDGLYHVTNRRFSAAFRVENGEVTWCAPILRRNLTYYMSQVKRIG